MEMLLIRCEFLYIKRNKWLAAESVIWQIDTLNYVIHDGWRSRWNQINENILLYI